MTDTAQDLNPDFNAKAAQLKALVEELTKDAPAIAKQVASQAKETACNATRKAVDVVRKHPVEAAVVAVGAGLLAWWLITRRNAATP